jgi:hypothetical protein
MITTYPNRLIRMTPTEALDYAITSSVVLPRSMNKPGAVVEKLPKDVREKLEALTSDDALKMRPLNCYDK